MKSDKSGNLLKEMRTHQQGCDYNKLRGGNCSQYSQIVDIALRFFPTLPVRQGVIFFKTGTG